MLHIDSSRQYWGSVQKVMMREATFDNSVKATVDFQRNIQNSYHVAIQFRKQFKNWHHVATTKYVTLKIIQRAILNGIDFNPTMLR